MANPSDIREESARILLVDAETAARDSLVRGLESAGYEVTATSHDSTWHVPADADLILAGASSDGWDVFGWYRRLRGGGARVPVLLVSSGVSEVPRAPADAADLLVTEPLATSQLLETVNRWLFARERRARRQAQRNALLIERLLANAAHDLRNPLNAILGWSTLLARSKELPAAALRAVQALDRSARLQAQILVDVEDHASIVSGKARLAITAIDPYPLVAVATADAAPDAAAAAVTIHTRLGPEAAQVAADTGRLQQALSRLVAHALKCSPQGGRIDVWAGTRGARFEMAVAHGGTLDQNLGSDLGWALIEQLVSLHGGSVEAGRDGGATEFKIALPLV
jgi:signal transduction histidine kinase